MDGLNISTRQGEGQAGVIDWSGFHNNIGKIYERSIQKGKEIRDTYDRTASVYGELANKVRPNDLPEFTERYNSWKDAELKKMNPKIQNNPKEYAKAAQESAKHFADMQETYKGSVGVTNDLMDRTKQWAMAKGIGMIPSEAVKNIQDDINKKSWRDVRSQGHLEVNNWIVPKINFPIHELDQYFKSGTSYNAGTKAEEMPVKGKKNTFVQVYKKGYTDSNELINRASSALVAVKGVQDSYENQYNQFAQTNPQIIKNRIDELHELNRNFPQVYDEAHFAIADMALNYKLKEEKGKEYEKLTAQQKQDIRDNSFEKRRIFSVDNPLKVISDYSGANPIQQLKSNAASYGEKVSYNQDGKEHTGYEVRNPDLIRQAKMNVQVYEMGKRKTETQEVNPDKLVVNENGEVEAIRYKRNKFTGKIVEGNEIEDKRIIPDNELADYYSNKTNPKKEAIKEKMLKGAENTKEKVKKTAY